MDDGGISPWTFHLSQEGGGREQLGTEDREQRGRYDEDEEDICRVCRGEATAETPLMHPWYVVPWGSGTD
jgi:hypothetical protein